MAFKLKSPFHAEVKTVGKQFGDGKAGVRGQGSNSSVVIGLKNTDIASVEGTQTVKPEPTSAVVEKQVKKVEEGIPLGLNPRQAMRLKVNKDKREVRKEDRTERQKEAAKRISKKQFGNTKGLTSEKFDAETKAAQDKLEKATLEAAAATTTANEKSRLISKNIKNYSLNDNLNIDGSKKLSLNMEGKPNRAGTPVRMLKSMEDTTPMKYKSVRKAGRENLMSALAKKGGVEEVEMVNDFTTNLDSGPEIDLGPVPPAPKKKTIPKKADIKKKQSKGKGGKVVIDRKVPVKF
jgi:hypothetical protein